jgi:hypothetical protein
VPEDVQSAARATVSPIEPHVAREATQLAGKQEVARDVLPTVVAVDPNARRAGGNSHAPTLADR